jgi:hypothetical protein
MLAETREPVIAEITRDVDDALRDLRPLARTYRHPGVPLLTTVELENVRKASPNGPKREGAIPIPGFGGYSPAGVFRTVAERACGVPKVAFRLQIAVSCDADPSFDTPQVGTS